MINFVVQKDKDGLYGLVPLSAEEIQRRRRYQAAETERAKADAFVARWREQGGYEGALERQTASSCRRGSNILAVPVHMPFPGHRHCGEWR